MKATTCSLFYARVFVVVVVVFNYMDLHEGNLESNLFPFLSGCAHHREINLRILNQWLDLAFGSRVCVLCWNQSGAREGGESSFPRVCRNKTPGEACHTRMKRIPFKPTYAL